MVRSVSPMQRKSPKEPLARCQIVAMLNQEQRERERGATERLPKLIQLTFENKENFDDAWI